MDRPLVLRKSHKTPLLPPNILHNHCLQFLLGHKRGPKGILKQCLCKYFLGVKEMYYGIWASGEGRFLLLNLLVSISKLLSSFESRNEEVCNKNRGYRPTKRDQKHILHILYRSKNQDLPHLAAEPYITIRSIRTF